MKETDTHTMEQHTRDRLRDYEKAWPELQRELASLRKDKARLDWLDANPNDIFHTMKAGYSVGYVDQYRGPIRKAIDSAKQSQ